MTQPPDSGSGTGDEPDRDSGLPGESAGAPAPGRDRRLAGFARGGTWDECLPGPELASALAGASGPEWRCQGATDDERVGLLRRWAALEAWAAAGKLGVIREMIRRDGDVPWPVPRHADLPDRPSESLFHELAAALAMPAQSAEKLAWLAGELQIRVPGIGALLASGTLPYSKVKAIVEEFSVLTDAGAAAAEALVLAAISAGAGTTYGQLQRLAARVACEVDPDGARKRREHAEREQARVRLWREQTGAAALAGYSLPTDEALAAHANVVARAEEYHRSKAFPGAWMDQIRVMAFLDLLNEVPAADRIAAARAKADASADPGTGSGEEAAPGAGYGTDTGRGADTEPVPGAGRGACTEPAAEAGARGGTGAGSHADAEAVTPTDQGHVGKGRTGTDADADAGTDAADTDADADTDAAGTDAADAADADSDTDVEEDDPGPGDPGPDDPDPDPGPRPGSGPRPGADPDANPGANRAVPPPRTDLVIPLATLFGLAERPGEGYGLGPIDPALARALAAAAASSPRSEWCLTITDEDGYAIAHGCARPAGKQAVIRSNALLSARVNLTLSLADLRRLTARPGSPAPPGGAPRPGIRRSPVGPRPPGDARRDDYGTWRLTLPGGRVLNVRLVPVPTFGCDHRYESHAYQPSDTLRHLVQVRDGTCTFPSCSRHARESDFEHALAYHRGGRTCACNAGARSRRCHRVKQSPGWKLAQPRPGWHQWTTPAGRVYTQGPRRYPV